MKSPRFCRFRRKIQADEDSTELARDGDDLPFVRTVLFLNDEYDVTTYLVTKVYRCHHCSVHTLPSRTGPPLPSAICEVHCCVTSHHEDGIGYTQCSHSRGRFVSEQACIDKRCVIWPTNRYYWNVPTCTHVSLDFPIAVTYTQSK
jgi:hypothetical protein